jgi:ribonuclease HI
LNGGAEQQKAFDDLKSYLQQLPMLSSLEELQTLHLYVSATHVAVGGDLVLEKKVIKNSKTVKQQFLVYFVSKVLTGSKRYYSKM